MAPRLELHSGHARLSDSLHTNVRSRFHSHVQYDIAMAAHLEALDELTSSLETSTLLDLARRFSENYKSLAQNSTEHFLTTPVTALPTGKEQGKFLAIDVGGSNLRVGFVELTGDSATADHGERQVEDAASTRIKRSHDKSWPIGDHLKMDQPEDLFNWIGDCMAEMIRQAIDDHSIPAEDDILLGVTFSFPMAYEIFTVFFIAHTNNLTARQVCQKPRCYLWERALPLPQI